MIFASGNGSHIEHGVPRGIDELVIPPTMQIIESLLKLARTNRCPSNANDPELPIRTLAETARRLGCNVNGYVVVNNQLIDGSLLAGG